MGDWMVGVLRSCHYEAVGRPNLSYEAELYIFRGRAYSVVQGKRVAVEVVTITG